MVRVLFRIGNDPNLPVESDMSAVSSAVGNQKKKIVTALFEAEADPD